MLVYSQGKINLNVFIEVVVFLHDILIEPRGPRLQALLSNGIY